MLRFIDIVCRTLPKNRVEQFCDRVYATDEEKYLVMERFVRGRTAEQCMEVSPQRQRFIVPYIDTKAQIFFVHDEDSPDKFFLGIESQAIKAEVLKYRTKNKEISELL